MANRRIPLEDQYIPEPNSGCWLWLGATDGDKGYGRVSPGTYGHRQAHRLFYTLHKGPIREGLVIDHKCRNPACVNPDHLEPVTPRENMRRGNYKDGLKLGGSVGSLVRKARTHCRKGHPWNEKNTAHQNGGARKCRACHAARNRMNRSACH